MEKIKVKKEGIILKKTEHSFECDGVLNPAAIKVADTIHLFYRALAKNNYSTIGYCSLSSPLTIEKRLEYPVLVPEFEYEKHGVEDPRIVKIDDLYYMTYTAYDGINALSALATSTDLKVWTKHGIVVPQITYEKFNELTDASKIINEKYARFNEHQIVQNKSDKVFLWSKNLVFFPKKIGGKLRFLHRIKPAIQIVSAIDNLEELTPEFWDNYLKHFSDYIVLSPRYPHEISYIGSGCPPIESEQGWLLIYHGVYDTAEGYVYCACAALLDLDNPQKEVARLPYALFEPEKSWELIGEVNDVCFPTGSVLEGDTLYIFYGAADKRIAVASVSFSDLLNELLRFKV